MQLGEGAPNVKNERENIPHKGCSCEDTEDPVRIQSFEAEVMQFPSLVCSTGRS